MCGEIAEVLKGKSLKELRDMRAALLSDMGHFTPVRVSETLVVLPDVSLVDIEAAIAELESKTQGGDSL
jgi:hypothetical protein